MADCDANYIRLLKLLPDLPSYREASLQALAQSGSRPSREDAIPAFPFSEGEGSASGSLSPGFGREFCITSPVEQGEEVRVRIRAVEVFRYTTTLEIAQLSRVSRWINPPAILVRLYHDAATAEAIAFQGHKAFLSRYVLPNARMYHQDEKRQINEFLGEWLTLCIQTGRSLKTPAFICAA